MSTTPTEQHVLTVRLPAADVARLDAAAREAGTTRSAFVRAVLTDTDRLHATADHLRAIAAHLQRAADRVDAMGSR